MSFVLPGNQIQVKSANVVLGPNVDIAPGSINETVLTPTTAGMLKVKKANPQSSLYYVESNTKRYVPQINDFVIGVLFGAFGEYFRISLNSFSPPVLLNQYSFPNASKKNRPRLSNGDLVYARVSAVERNVDVELSCIDATTGKEGGFGVLSDGLVFDVKLAFARYLLFNSDAEIFTQLVKRCKFEIAIGVNGRIWIKTDDIKTTIACVNVIRNSQNWTKEELPAKIEDTFKVLKTN
ncbi:hypothetical protein FOA43_003279 [Brettanomyces nanus]|uniref:Ribosomal RNA-processing protein 40 n=1 Tax=Eeniella nana TaxID=13502 RepID=A0A875S4Q3_EENNA|nr:uncharacterized protein FOA43_003279 [Brettanomyces nanus]QPG75893.1 hypothetical protein FOA43_003279 [Brettanomyces nanus]